jgi:hypothetical protein
MRRPPDYSAILKRRIDEHAKWVVRSCYLKELAERAEREKNAAMKRLMEVVPDGKSHAVAMFKATVESVFAKLNASPVESK